jgi:dTDP-4-amino-4,6-dideoxygalactose transaminase
MNQEPRTANVSPYEIAFGERLGRDVRAFAFWKGRAALEAILRAFGVSAGDEVVMPGFTCVVVPDAIRRVGATPVFADIETQGYNADGPQVEAAISPRTRAVIAQHSFGIVADLGFLMDMCERRGLLLVEDSCHALGAYYQGHGTDVEATKARRTRNGEEHPQTTQITQMAGRGQNEPPMHTDSRADVSEKSISVGLGSPCRIAHLCSSVASRSRCPAWPQQPGIHVGLVGHAGFFSSQWSKPYTTGLGGMAVAARKDVAEKIEAVYRQCKPPSKAALARLWFQFTVYSRFFTPQLFWTAQAAIRGLSKVGLFVGSSSTAELAGEVPEDHDWLMGPSQQKWGLRELAKLDAVLEHRKAIAALYDAELAKQGWPALPRPEGSMLLRYPVRVGNKEELLDKAKQARVELGSWFESPLHPLSLSEHHRLGYRVGQCPNAERAARECVNLPLHEKVTPAETERVLDFLFKNCSPRP